MLNFLLPFSFISVAVLFVSLQKIHNEGYRFYFILLIISFAFQLISLYLGLFGYLFTLFVLWFFRDPERNAPADINAIISPADGTICKIDKVKPPLESEIKSDSCLRICIFMSVFNVHVNRAPIKGIINKIIYIPGKFFVASLDKASEHNERNILVMENDKKESIVVVQIAGLIARRILSFVRESEKLILGQRFGLIRFGSRVDVYLPLKYETSLTKGDKVKAGESILANHKK
ncbi:MAG: phosphatidylserine decarboxylase family protein [Candidatus Marinimicrobia bacterium]|nr:phosphatidylserine decarboxylase family protein [Candidatus Neomarinimicrobiota bacterium]